MESPAPRETYAQCIKCSTCDVAVPLDHLAEHVCGQVTGTTMFEEPEHTILLHVRGTSSSAKPARPQLLKLDPSAMTKTGVHGELTPVSSGYGSATASPTSPGRLSVRSNPARKVSASSRRPPSPELLSQDCAFPHFPTTKNKKEKTLKNSREPARHESTSSKPFEQHRMRSASFSTLKVRTRQGTLDSSRPSTANSSRQASLSSRSGSRQGSIDVPPLPPLQATISFAHTDSDSSAISLSLEVSEEINRHVAKAPPLSQASEQQTFPEHHEQLLKLSPASNPAGLVSEPPFDNVPTNSQTAEPRYRTKRPSALPNLPSSMLDSSSISRPEPSPTPTNTSSTSSNALSRTLTSFFSRKRNVSIGSKKSASKAPITSGPRFVALSLDPDPQEVSTQIWSPRSSFDQEKADLPSPSGISVAPRASVEVHTGHHIPEPSQGHILNAEDGSEFGEHDTHDLMHEDRQSESQRRGSLHLERDLQYRLTTMASIPQVAVIGDEGEDLRRASIDSASSYGSIGFSPSSNDSRSFQGYEGHSQGSSISTARTASSIDEMMLLPKSRNTDVVPDSPTDPYMYHGRLESVPEAISPRETETTEVDSYFHNSRLSTVHEALSSTEDEKPGYIASIYESVSPSPQSEMSKFDFSKPPTSTLLAPQISESTAEDKLSLTISNGQRRPSTPGAYRGTCRGCLKGIVSGQKSVSSKDGQLSGKYHKECFGCMTCKEPFATADFYVHHDHPYCAHHYHEINGTLCEGCGQGIEGQYLETSNVTHTGAKKYHPDCLQCATCKTQLSDDYFELAGRVYCERDAFRVASSSRSPYATMPTRPSPLNREYISSAEPGLALAAGRFPERRLTKLMTTY